MEGTQCGWTLFSHPWCSAALPYHSSKTPPGPLVCPPYSSFLQVCGTCKASKPRSHFRAAAARIIFLGWAGFEELDFFFSSYGAWNSLASSHYWLLFVEPASYFNSWFISIMGIFTSFFFFFFPLNMWRLFIYLFIFFAPHSKGTWEVLVFWRETYTFNNIFYLSSFWLLSCQFSVCLACSILTFAWGSVLRGWYIWKC